MIASAWLLWSMLVPPPPTAPAPPPAPTASPSPTPTERLVEGPRVIAVDEALARLPSSPSLAEAQAGALARAGLDPEVAGTWMRRARSSAALPTVSVQYDRRFDRAWTLDQAAGEADALRNDAGNQDVLRGKATWELDRLIFAPDELRVARALLDVADFRERLLIEVTRLYFERERLRLAQLLAPPTDVAAAIEANVRLREVEGLLAGLTGLEFGATGPTPPPGDLGADARR